MPDFTPRERDRLLVMVARFIREKERAIHRAEAEPRAPHLDEWLNELQDDMSALRNIERKLTS